jgi:transcriptional regulator with XRE-family HTH domain
VTIIEKIRIEHNLKHKEMMEKLGISKAYYSMISRGLRPISKEIAAKLKSTFNVPYEVSFCTEVHMLDTKNSKRKEG